MVVNALSIVSPSVQHIVAGKKVVEIRRWLPPEIPFLNLVLVENEIQQDMEQVLSVSPLDKTATTWELLKRDRDVD